MSFLLRLCGCAPDHEPKTVGTVLKSTETDVTLPVPSAGLATKTQAPAPERKSNSKKTVPYTPQGADALFDQYADEDTPESIGPEGLERLCADGEIPLEGALPLILAWQLGSIEMGQFTRTEWGNGMSALQYVNHIHLSLMYLDAQLTCRIADLSVLKAALCDLEALLIAPNGKPAKHSPASYSKDRYGQYARDPKKAFRELYMFCFALAKPEWVSRHSSP